MEIENNKNAYEFLLKIEVGVREFLIDSIKTRDVNEWAHSFLGSHRIKHIKMRTRNSYINTTNDKILFEQEFLIKIQNAYSQPNSAESQIHHPFYYLNWEDLISMLGQKSIEIVLNTVISNDNRLKLIDELKNLKGIRNDVAHCRCLNSGNILFIQGSYSKIQSLLPNFDNFYQSITKERNWDLNFILNDVNEFLESNIEKREHAKQLCTDLKECVKSFWLNMLVPDTISIIKKLIILLEEWINYSNQFGGLREITMRIEPSIKQTISLLETSNE